ncbi:Sapep family Mn(2+)-dependent dipeptidase [Candidatus Pantoea multigeneris]|uniref:M20 family metallopeptidase n=1 Tax=Candidatus Pantoea multigeneris TaxID=2608357 RepID=A0ABX0RA94_9GAMM|nr:Sapep family Mn(2+)-dependent dipeptidase [Pantoea multigeneris]NIF22266.1 M20 family metallopeptidase [Pantoea multigeneris]
MPAALSPSEKALLPLIDQWINQHRPQFIADLAGWIAHASVSRADLALPGAPFGPACAALLQEVLAQAQTAGFRTENHQGYAGTVVYGQQRYEIGLIAHLDVVPAGDNWTFPPFQLTQHGDFLTGRGVGDNKGPALMNLYLLRLLRDLNIPLHHNLRLIYGVAEETTMADLIWYQQHAAIPEYSLVTDGFFPVNHAQKGQLTFTLRLENAGELAAIRAGNASNSIPANAELIVDEERIKQLAAQQQNRHHDVTLSHNVMCTQGSGGHAAWPEGSTNAALRLLSAPLLLDYLPVREQQLAHQLVSLFASPYGAGFNLSLEDEASGKLTLNAGLWQGDGPGTLRITCDIRYPVSCRGEEIIARIKAQIAGSELVLEDQWEDSAPFYLPANHPVISLLQESWNALSRRDDPSYAMGGLTYSKVFPRAITFGPGYQPTAENTPDFLPPGHGFPHAADETLHLPSLLQALPHYVIALIRLDGWLHHHRQK